MNEIESQPNKGRFNSSVPMLIAVAFLGTADVLAWDPWGHAKPLPAKTSSGPKLPPFALPRVHPKPISYYGSENCKACHSKREYRKLWNDWTKGGHKDVECETCHGPAGDHALRDVDPRPQMAITSEMLAQPHALCMGCHGKIPGRKTTVRQIECEKHLADFKVQKDDPDYEKSRQCINCHDAHRPVKK